MRSAEFSYARQVALVDTRAPGRRLPADPGARIGRVGEPIRYCDWCKSRLEWDQRGARWVCSNTDCRWASSGMDMDTMDRKRPGDSYSPRGRR